MLKWTNLSLMLLILNVFPIICLAQNTNNLQSIEIKVNNEIIYSEKINKIYAFHVERIKKNSEGEINNDRLKAIQQEISDLMLRDFVIRQEAKKKNISIDKKILDRAYQQFIYNIPEKEKREKYIASVYGHENGIKYYIESRLLLEKLANEKTNKVVTPEQAQLYYDQYPFFYANKGIALEKVKDEITAKIIQRRKDSQTKQILSELLQQAKIEGATFMSNPMKEDVQRYSVLKSKLPENSDITVSNYVSDKKANISPNILPIYY